MKRSLLCLLSRDGFAWEWFCWCFLELPPLVSCAFWLSRYHLTPFLQLDSVSIRKPSFRLPWGTTSSLPPLTYPHPASIPLSRCSPDFLSSSLAQVSGDALCLPCLFIQFIRGSFQIQHTKASTFTHTLFTLMLACLCSKSLSYLLRNEGAPPTSRASNVPDRGSANYSPSQYMFPQIRSRWHSLMCTYLHIIWGLCSTPVESSNCDVFQWTGVSTNQPVTEKVCQHLPQTCFSYQNQTVFIGFPSLTFEYSSLLWNVFAYLMINISSKFSSATAFLRKACIHLFIHPPQNRLPSKYLCYTYIYFSRTVKYSVDVEENDGSSEGYNPRAKVHIKK